MLLLFLGMFKRICDDSNIAMIGFNDVTQTPYKYNFYKDTLLLICGYANDTLQNEFRALCSVDNFDEAQWIFGLGMTLEDVKSQENYAFRWSCKKWSLGNVSMDLWTWIKFRRCEKSRKLCVSV